MCVDVPKYMVIYESSLYVAEWLLLWFYFVCHVVWHNHKSHLDILNCFFTISSICRLPGDCVTTCWHALCERGTTASQCLLRQLWTPSCGPILSQNAILWQLMNLEFLLFHLSLKGWLAEIMGLVQWLNLFSSTQP